MQITLHHDGRLNLSEGDYSLLLTPTGPTAEIIVSILTARSRGMLKLATAGAPTQRETTDAERAAFYRKQHAKLDVQTNELEI